MNVYDGSHLHFYAFLYHDRVHERHDVPLYDVHDRVDVHDFFQRSYLLYEVHEYLKLNLKKLKLIYQ